MRRFVILAALAAGLVTTPAHAADDVTEEEVGKIMAVLQDLQCEMDEDDIEKEDDGYELDDVFCSDGQYDIDLDADFAVVEKRKE
ncbi:MAG: PepSY domain-containing protein [Pseudomonadota bacterium]